MNKRFGIIALILVIGGGVVGGLFGRLPQATSADNSVTPARVIADYREALDVIDKNYVGPVRHEEITDSSIQGMLFALDPHSSFFTRDELRKLMEEQASEFYGIGVSILQHHDGVYVQAVIPNTPAQRAGLRYGDRIIRVDGKDAREWTSAEVSKNVRGPKDTPVKVTVERAGSSAPVEYEIVRGGVPLPSIRNYFMLPDGVGYIGLTGGFQETTAAELDDAVADLRKRGMKSLLLDLRGNPGGILEQAIEVVSRFIPENNVVVSVKGRTNYAKERQHLSRGGATIDTPVVVLINGGSASASEIVAGALQDYGRGLIVGTESFGKGLVQRVYPLPYGTGLTLTTARYYTPFGRALQRDYSGGSIYQYYMHGDEPESEGQPQSTPPSAPAPAGSPVVTPDGRKLYSGRGIEPDVRIPGQNFSQLRSRIAEASFYFVRQLVAGRIAGFENYKVDKPTYKTVLSPGELAVGDKLLEAFKAFAAADKSLGLSAENVAAQPDYARTRIRQELATANFSSEAGVQVLLENDPQIIRAVELVPQAAKMNQSVAYKRPSSN
ncbi:MAG: S41 family peptidase [Pyrinomonadaceae bacterium]